MIDTSVIGLFFMVGLAIVVYLATKDVKYAPRKQPYKRSPRRVFDYIFKA